MDVSERTISGWMKRAPRDPEPARRWLTFLRNHREAIAAPGQQAISIEHTSDHFIRTDSRQHSHGIDNRFRCLRAILPTPPERQPQLRVHATLPVKSGLSCRAMFVCQILTRAKTHQLQQAL